jgi:hypothetical protein
MKILKGLREKKEKILNMREQIQIVKRDGEDRNYKANLMICLNPSILQGDNHIS